MAAGQPPAAAGCSSHAAAKKREGEGGEGREGKQGGGANRFSFSFHQPR